jgi:hypothetical protein
MNEDKRFVQELARESAKAIALLTKVRVNQTVNTFDTGSTTSTPRGRR